ncbi:MAG: DNA polymerase III subunit epsilon [Alphaproteobacteria bacterium]|nr:DNA polymerase III subunit epsilon [Alphaproteobacteria bacterium]
MREIALDTETTGLDPNSGHRIVEIGCVEMIDRISTGEVFHVYLNPERDMPEEAYRVHGLSEEFLADKQKFAAVADDFLHFVQQSPLVIHNAQFDMKFINYELKKIGKEIIPMSRTIDTVIMARKKFPGSPANLDALCKRFEIDLSARTLHGALLDAELLADVYLELTGGRQSKLTLKRDDDFAKPQQKTQAPVMETRNFPPSAQEREDHLKFLQTQLKDALWLEEK